MKRFTKDYTELGHNTMTGITKIKNSKGIEGVKFISYVAVEASRDGKETFEAVESEDRDYLVDYAQTRVNKDLPKDRVILIYQSENYKYPKRVVESDMALVKIIPEMEKWDKISLGYWTDKNLEG